MKTLLALCAAAAVATFAGTADAQVRGGDRGADRGRNPGITLYDLPNFQGPSRSFAAGVDNLADQGYNDRAQSVRVEGLWRLCEDARLRGRCVEVSGDVPNLGDLRMSVTVSSFEPLGGYGGDRGDYRPPGGGFDRDPPYRPGPNPGPLPPRGPGGYAGESLDGRTVSFFPRPAPGPYRDADQFCRRLGFNGAIYADDRGRDLRDVLCRR